MGKTQKHNEYPEETQTSSGVKVGFNTASWLKAQWGVIKPPCALIMSNQGSGYCRSQTLKEAEVHPQTEWRTRPSYGKDHLDMKRERNLRKDLPFPKSLQDRSALKILPQLNSQRSWLPGLYCVCFWDCDLTKEKTYG